MKLKDILANLFILGISLFLLPNPTLAQTEFDASAKIVYEAGPRGNGTANQEIKLTNNFSHIYPKEYELEIIGSKIKNIQASDQEGSILTKVQEKNEKTIINLAFNDPSVGKGKTTAFTIRYNLPDLATKRGQIWEVAIPRIANFNEFKKLELSIKIPTSFGSLSYSSVNPISQENLNNKLILNYQKTQIGENPILLAFGEFQIFNFDLDFSLFNNQNKIVSKTIPIPPDTSYQSIFLTDIKPKPVKIYADQDFNWLALYELNPGETKVIKVKGQAKIFAQPENKKFSNLYKNKSLQAYLADDQFWEVNSPVIQNLTDYFSTPTQIYDFVVNHLEYDYENIKQSQRVGAVKAFQQKSGLCTEFSDLFVTLARANGIPARELEGFAFTEDKKLVSLAAENDILHSWVEYWDSGKEIWVPADPTWAKTTQGIDFISDFDLGHFAFVIHGQSSTKPAPPGFYKTSGQKKNVKVEFAEKLIPPPEPRFQAQLISNRENLQLKIKNSSFSPIYNPNLILLGWNKKRQNKERIKFLPPLGEKTFQIESPSFWAKLFSKPVYKLTINQKLFKLNYPKKTLNLINFFANL